MALTHAAIVDERAAIMALVSGGSLEMSPRERCCNPCRSGIFAIRL